MTGNWPFVSHLTGTWRDGHPVAVDDRTLLFLLLGRLQAGALLHIADRLVALPLALRAGPGSGQQDLTYIKRRGRGGRLRWRFRGAVEVVWGQKGTRRKSVRKPQRQLGEFRNRC